MRWAGVTVAAALAFMGTRAGGAEALGTWRSQVYEATADRHEIVRRAYICLSQTLKAGISGTPPVISQDPDAGVLVANNAFTFSWGFVPMKISARSTITLEAKDGRFRITHTNIEQFDERLGWHPVWTGTETTEKSVAAAVGRVSEEVANCVRVERSNSDF